MENENPILIGMSAITGTLILYMSYSMNNPLLLGVALTIYGIGFGGAIWNKFQELNRTIINTRRNTKKHEEVNRLRREFRGTPLIDLIPLTTVAQDGKGFGDGIYGDTEEQ